MSFSGDLKKIYEKIPENVKFAFAPIIHDGLIKNPIFLKQYDELVQAENMSEFQIDKLQFQKLKDLA